MTVAEYLRVWMRSLEGAVAIQTQTTYSGVVRLHLVPVLGHHELATLTRQDVRAYVLGERRLGRSAQVCRLRLAVLRRALFDAVDEGLLTTNPAADLWRRVPPELRVRRQPGRFALRDGCGPAVLIALAAAHPDIYRLVLTYALSGMRRNEGLGLQIGDLDFTAGTIRVARQWHGGGQVGELPKGRRVRVIDMAEELKPELEAAVHASRALVARLGCPPEPAWLFRSPRGGVPWSPKTVNYVLAQVSLETVGRRIGPKSFRHTVATTLMNGGVSPRYVQGLLGHAHLTTTMLYVAEESIRDPSALRVLSRRGGS